LLLIDKYTVPKGKQRKQAGHGAGGARPQAPGAPRGEGGADATTPRGHDFVKVLCTFIVSSKVYLQEELDEIVIEANKKRAEGEAVVQVSEATMTEFVKRLNEGQETKLTKVRFAAEILLKSY
jgi:hypothetical protein